MTLAIILLLLLAFLIAPRLMGSLLLLTVGVIGTVVYLFVMLTIALA